MAKKREPINPCLKIEARSISFTFNVQRETIPGIIHLITDKLANRIGQRITVTLEREKKWDEML